MIEFIVKCGHQDDMRVMHSICEQCCRSLEQCLSQLESEKAVLEAVAKAAMRVVDASQPLENAFKTAKIHPDTLLFKLDDALNRLRGKDGEKI